MPWPLFTPGKDPVPIAQEAGWAPGPVWTDAENLALTGVQSPDRPANSQSVYRLRYPAHQYPMYFPKILWFRMAEAVILICMDMPYGLGLETFMVV